MGLNELFCGEDKAAVYFSGGIDSLVMLHYLQPVHKRLVVFYRDTGAAFPHVREFVFDCLAKYNLEYQIVSGGCDVMQLHRAVGLPADIVPMNNHPVILESKEQTSAPKFIPWVECCRAVIWDPLWNAVVESGLKVILRGQKLCDGLKGTPDGSEQDGITVRHPLNHWTDEDVKRYARDNQLQLPEQYKTIKDSLDCHCCTAPLFGGIGKAQARLDFMKENYPLQYASLIKKLESLHTCSMAATLELGELLEGRCELH